jgi:hypothetical protein
VCVSACHAPPRTRPAPLTHSTASLCTSATRHAPCDTYLWGRTVLPVSNLRKQLKTAITYCDSVKTSRELSVSWITPGNCAGFWKDQPGRPFEKIGGRTAPTCSRGYPGPQTMPKYRINKTTQPQSKFYWLHYQPQSDSGCMHKKQAALQRRGSAARSATRPRRSSAESWR